MSSPSARLAARLIAYRPRIERHVRAMVRDADLAEEVTQETYARAFARAGQLRDPQAALAWLYRIATNVCLDRLWQRKPPLPSTLRSQTMFGQPTTGHPHSGEHARARGDERVRSGLPRHPA